MACSPTRPTFIFAAPSAMDSSTASSSVTSLLRPLSSCGVNCSPHSSKRNDERDEIHDVRRATSSTSQQSGSVISAGMSRGGMEQPNASMRDNWSKTSLMNSYSSSDDSLVEQLSEYEEKGWLTRTEYVKYRQMLQKEPQSKVHRRRIEKELEEISFRFKHGNVKLSDSPTISSLGTMSMDQSSLQPPSILGRGKTGGGGSSKVELHVSWEDQSKSSKEEDEEEEDKENEARKGGTSAKVLSDPPLVMEPSELWSGAVSLTQQEMQELFVEMCFFARLGFVQPPCCLQCTYRESMGKKKGPRPDCTRWVVWRKNAQNTLHPERLDGNIMIVQCHVARELLEGKKVEGRRWDAQTKKVVMT